MTIYDLLFPPEKRDAVCERIWHHTQQLDVRKDGWVRRRFTVGRSEEVTAWICAWRTGVRVLAPKSEIIEVFKYCAWGVELYGPMMPKKRGTKPRLKAPQA